MRKLFSNKAGKRQSQDLKSDPEAYTLSSMFHGLRKLRAEMSKTEYCFKYSSSTPCQAFFSPLQGSPVRLEYGDSICIAKSLAQADSCPVDLFPLQPEDLGQSPACAGVGESQLLEQRNNNHTTQMRDSRSAETERRLKMTCLGS